MPAVLRWLPLMSAAILFLAGCVAETPTPPARATLVPPPTATYAPTITSPPTITAETPTPPPKPTATAPPTTQETPSTPRPPSAFKRVELDPDYPPSSMFGNEYASIGPNGEVHIINAATGERRQLTDDGHRKRRPVISADYVAWSDQRRQIEIPDRNSIRQNRTTFADDIYVLDLATGQQRRITDAPANRYALGLSGHRLVWQDTRNELDEPYFNFDIYAYDLIANQEIPIAVEKGSQRSPSIYGDTVVWADNRNSPSAETPNPDLPNPGCGDCPDNRFDIYAYDFNTGKERPLVQSGYFNAAPQIHGDRVGWQAYHPEKALTLKLLNLATGRESEIATEPRINYGPSLSANYAVWTVGYPCDVSSDDSLDGTGAYAQNLATGEVSQISDYIEPYAAIFGKVALVIEYCTFRIWRVYALFLD